MKLSVIIVNYNVKYYVEQCLYSLSKALDGIDSEIFVVDNDSSDNSVSYIKERFPDVKVIECSSNLGFSRANNIAIKQSAGEYILLLNPDTFVAEATIKESVEFLDANSKAGGIGVRMHNSDGTLAMESRRGLPTPLTSFFKMTGLCSRFPQSRVFGKYYMGYLSWDEAAQIDIISGAYCMIRKKALDKIGLLDEDFFMYGEDIDLSYRLTKGGFENWYLPHSILHYKGESTHKSSFKYVHVFYQAMLIFFRKHYGNKRFYVTIPIKLAIYGRSLIALMQIINDNLKASLGFVDINHNERSYIFIGSNAMLEKCRKIAFRKGLKADYHSIDSAIADKGHNALSLNNKNTTVVVYDLEVFSFSKLLSIMSENPSRNIMLGTYNPESEVLITHNETIV